MELLDVFNRENTKKIMEEDRDIVHKNSLWHRQVAIWVMNDKNEVLLQRRSPQKKQHPNKYSVCAGHIDANEEVILAALRELKEEIGLSETIGNIEFIDMYVNEEEGNNNFKYTYLIRTNKKINEFKMQDEEVCELKYITLDELEKMIKNEDEELTFSKKYYAKLILQELKSRRT
ncbi:MAG: hypothetical protein K0R72_1292 [Clostridia bacterium]|jgi:isopentenyldiphosphate isomerase|nr:hypothetical protein [Clostridia bacterium]